MVFHTDLEAHADVEEDHDGHGDDEEEQRRPLEQPVRHPQGAAVGRLWQGLQDQKEREAGNLN